MYWLVTAVTKMPLMTTMKTEQKVTLTVFPQISLAPHTNTTWSQICELDLTLVSSYEGDQKKKITIYVMFIMYCDEWKRENVFFRITPPHRHTHTHRVIYWCVCWWCGGDSFWQEVVALAWGHCKWLRKRRHMKRHRGERWREKNKILLWWILWLHFEPHHDIVWISLFVCLWGSYYITFFFCCISSGFFLLVISFSTSKIWYNL